MSAAAVPRGIIANLGHLMGGKAGAGIISLAYIALAARQLGASDYGVLNLVHGYATFLGGLIAFSGFHGMTRYGTQAWQSGDVAQFRGLIRCFALLELGLAAIAIAIAMLLVPLAGPKMGWSAQTIQFGTLYCLAILATVRTTPHGLLQIADRFELIGLQQMIMPLVRLIGAGWAWMTGAGLQSFLWIWLAGALAEGLSMWLLAWWVWRAKLGQRKRDETTLSLAELRNRHPDLLRFAWTTNFDITLREFAPRITPLIIGWMAGPVATGLYALATRVTAVLYQPAQLLGQAAYPVVVQLITAGKDAEARQQLSRATKLTVAASALVLVIVTLFGRQILAMMGGEEFMAGYALVVLVAVGRVIMMIAPLQSALLTAMGKPEASLRASLWSNIALLPLLPLLLVWQGAEGAGWHIILQAILLVAILQLSVRQAWRNRAVDEVTG